MLLERIEIESGGSLEHLQLGPFSHRLNAVYGADSTATISFIRSLILGSDRDWHRGSDGSVVWENRRTDLTARTIKGLIAATRQTSIATILAGCRDAGLGAPRFLGDESEAAGIRTAIADLDCRLAGYPVVASTRADLEATRRRLVAELDALDRAALTPIHHDGHRDDLRLRLSETRDEVIRLGHQESELRHLIAEIERDLLHSAEPSGSTSSHWRIATAHRRQLEELDNELMQWRRALRDISAIRTSSEDASSEAAIGRRVRLRSAEFRVTAAIRQIDRLARRYDRSRWSVAATGEDTLGEDGYGETAVPSHLAMADVDAVAHAVRVARRELRQLECHFSDGHRDRAAIGDCPSLEQEALESSHVWHNERGAPLRRCEEMLVWAIDRLIESRNALLRQIAAEYDLPLGQLTEAFGDWQQCHDHPHLYQWLLSDKCPPRIDDMVVRAARSSRLERERSRLLDDLGRTVNRLDSQSNELRSLESRWHRLPLTAPAAIPNRRREACHAELSRIDEQLAWLSGREPLEEKRQRLERRLGDLLRGAVTSWPLLTRASQWLTRLSTGRVARLEIVADGSLCLDGSAAAQLGEVERQTLSLALRMAAVEELARQGRSVPLLVDEPPSGLRVGDTPWRVATALSRFVEAGRQVIVFTESRPLVNAIANVGGHLQSLETPQYIHMRYRDDRQQCRPASPAVSLHDVNRDLDMAWREANGLYDDPYWYRPTQWRHGQDPFPQGLGPRNGRRSGGQRRVEVRQPPRDAASPFFLTAESPVDQAPSIDPLIATRLGIIGITRVGHLLVSDSHYIARCLHLPDVTPQVVQRWQNEAQLVCRVPQLRNFDARVLVGCGFVDPRQLAQMHAGQLLEKVEAFLATERGRQILRSGTSYELSRITSWIAAANRSVSRGIRHGERTQSADGTARHELPEGRSSEDEGPKRSGRRRRSGREGAERTSGRRRDRRQAEPTHAAAPRGVVAMRVAEPTTSSTSEPKIRFHLHLRSPVVDAPAIGPKTAARLARLAIRTVDDLLKADPAVVAAELGNRKIDEQRVRQWQQQATLVCRVPLLRGDDAELLVAVGVVDPERLAQCDPQWLLSQIAPVAHSPRGKRILRGAAAPDSVEVSEWIEWAKERRSLRAA